MSIPGQIPRGSKAGEMIYDLASKKDIRNIVEIGTWNGMGTTKCVIDAISGCDPQKNFISIELYPEMLSIAKENLGADIKFVKLLSGRIVSFDDTFWFDHSSLDFNTDDHARLWYEKDMNLLKNSINVIDQLPERIDLLILDGGEYSTYPEWKILKDRTKIVVLDDTNILKCRRVRQEILESNKYQTLFDDLNLRNGFSIFSRI